MKEIKNQLIQLNGQSGRLDIVLASELNESRSVVQKIIKKKNVKVNGEVAKANLILNGDEEIEFFQEPADENAQQSEELPVAENIPLDIVFEDDYLLVVNKQRGMVVHPSKGHSQGTLVNALMYYLSAANLSQDVNNIRPGIVHRIDKDTSGLLVVAKDNQTHQLLSELLIEHDIDRTYVALVHGIVSPDEGTIEIPLKRDPNDRLRWSGQADGRTAISHFKVIKRYENVSLLQVNLETGRTHQIRVHLEYIGHPIVGDPIYQRGLVKAHRNPLSLIDAGQLLHAKSLKFVHPHTNETMEFHSELPEDMEKILQTLTDN